MPGGPPALGTLFGLVGRGEQPLPACGALVQLLQQQPDEDGDERAGDELAADGVQPESSESQTTWVGGADGWFIEFVQGHVLKLHLRRERKGRSSEGEAHTEFFWLRTGNTINLYRSLNELCSQPVKNIYKENNCIGMKLVKGK